MTSTTFPAKQTYIVNYGNDLVFKLDYLSETEVRFTGLVGKYKGYIETAPMQVAPIRPSVFMLTWQEKSKNTIVHIEDFENEISYTNITLPDMTFIRLKGSLKKHE